MKQFSSKYFTKMQRLFLLLICFISVNNIDLYGSLISPNLASTLIASVDAVIEADIAEVDGIIQVSFEDDASQTNIMFSIDGGVSYPFVFDDSAGSGVLTGLGADTYEVWAAFGDESSATNLGSYTVNEIEYTQIPDANFESALYSLNYDNYLGDFKTPTSLINTVPILDLSQNNINDLTGIEDFTNLADLIVSNNTLTNLDVSNNLDLEVLDFDYNNVTNLVLGSNTNLSEVSGRYNQLTSVDVSQNTGLTNLNLRNNTFTTVDVSTNSSLTTLNLNQTGITTLDITNNPSLAYLYLSGNSLSNIDLTQNPLLENVNLKESELTAIDLSDQAFLRIIRLSGNNLTELDLTANIALTQVECAENDLNVFNFKNGFNQNITDFDASDNPNLECILIDNLSNDYTFWTKDFETAFSDTYCRYTAVPDTNFEGALDALGYDDIADDGQVPTALIEDVTSLDLRNEGISTLVGIEDFVALVELDISDNTILDIDLSNNLVLEKLFYENNGISSIDVSLNTALKELDLDENLLTTLDVSQNIELVLLDLSDNELTSLDIANDTALTFLAFERNNVTGYIDLSKHNQLTILACNENDIRDLNLQNGNNTNIISYNSAGNSNLSCILIDDLNNNYSTWIKDPIASFSDTYCRYTAIPDINFEAALDSLGYEDISADGKVPTALIETITSLAVAQKSITDLSGIEDFTALTSLNCRTNNLTSVDLSENLLLESFVAWENELTSLDVSDNLALEVLSIRSNNLTSIDVSNNSSLRFLQINNNDITELDVNNNPDLEILKVYDLDLVTLDLSNNLALEELIAYSTQITDFDFSNNPVLQTLEIHNNAITSIDFSHNPLLKKLRINQTQIEDLDLTHQTSLTFLRCFQTNLYNLNVQNGNNTNVTTFDAWSNPNLSCILVDDATYSTESPTWSDNIDTGVTFNEGIYCRYTAIPDANFEAELESLGYDDISGDGQVPTQLIEEIESINLESKGIADITGIEDFRALSILNLGFNSLSTVDVTNNTELKQLIVRGNPLISIDLSGNASLVSFKAENCSLTSLDVTSNLDLKVLWLTGNNLTSIDVSNNIVLTSFLGNDNEFITLDLSTNPALTVFRANNNNLLSLNLQNGGNTNIVGGINFQLVGNEDLACVLVDDASYSDTTWLLIDGNVNFSDTDCNYTLIPDANFEDRLDALEYDDVSADGRVPTRFIEVLTSLNVSNQEISDLTGIEDFTALQYLVCTNNTSLTSIDVSSNINLLTLSAFNCGLTDIDVTNNTNLQRLIVYGNSIDSLDVSHNTQLIEIDLLANDLTSLDVTNNVLLQTLFVSDNNISSLDLTTNSSLAELSCQNNNNLSYLNIKNGNNTNVTNFVANNLPNLTCIVVDDLDNYYSTWTKDATTIFSDIDCRYTMIPDINFEAALDTLGYDDISGDGQVPTALIEVVIDLDVKGKNITDITGVEDFTALQTFNCNLNAIDTIDVSSNTSLKELQCTVNPISNLNLSNNTQLTELNCRGTNITSLDVTNNTQLTRLICFDTDIATIDLSKNLLLKDLYCYNTDLTGLNLSLNTELRILETQNCALTYLNIQNGNNTNVTNFNALGNPDLSCIEVDDLANDYTEWDKDDSAIFSDSYCRYTAIPDTSFETVLRTLGYDDGDTNDGQVPTTLIEVASSLNISNKGISDLTGIEDFISLTYLNVTDNTLGILDVSNNINLETLDCQFLALTSLNLTSNTMLRNLYANGNTFTGIDLSTNTELIQLGLYSNNLNTIDLNNNPLLKELDLYNNELAEIDLSSNPLLEVVLLEDNNLLNLDLSSNPVVEIFNFNNNDLISLNFQNENNTNIALFTATNNPSLSCILVENAEYSTENWSASIDDITSFSDTPCPIVCATTSTYTTAGGWDNGIPDDMTKAIFQDSYDTSLGNITACQVIVQDGATLIINESQYVRVESDITIKSGGMIVVKDQGSLGGVE